MTDRVRVWDPPPQTCEHCDQAVNPESTQSTGHACLLHLGRWSRAGHCLPPYRAGVTTERVRDLVPVAHDFVHAPNRDHRETAQSTGHRPRLQDRAWNRPPQRLPPSRASVRTVRDRDWVPYPLAPSQQDCVQGVHLLNVLSWQSTGQACGLQVRAWAAGHAAPPCLAATFTVRERDWVPVPHDSEHMVHAFHSCSQSMGHGWVLQFW
jgi:hypothetical protein